MHPFTDPLGTNAVAAVDPYAAFYMHLDRTVRQLVSAALEHAREASAKDPEIAVPTVATPTLAPRSGVHAASIQRAPLSDREREVLLRIAAGDSNKMIARRLELSPHTVKRHVANILDKLGARTRGQAAAWLLSHQ